MANYLWIGELPALSALSDFDAADAINKMMVDSPTVPVFGSFRTLAALLSQLEYNTLRAALGQAAGQETAKGGTLLADMIVMLQTPGDESGNGGGLDFTAAGFMAMLDALCSAGAANLPDVPGKVAAYVASKQVGRVPKYNPGPHEGDVAAARKAVA